MSILSGYKKVKDYILTSTGYQLLSRWTNANTVEADDGKTLQTKVGAINGIAKTYNEITTTTDSSFAASATAVKEGFDALNSKFEKLLWINANIYEFAPQKIALDLSGYDFVEIVFSFYNANEVAVQKFAVGTSGQLVNIRFDAVNATSVLNALNGAYRAVVISTDGITFMSGTQTYNGIVYENWNDRCIPLRVYGIKVI